VGPAVQLGTAPGGARYLTDAKGMTLSYHTLDTNGQSACSGPCAERWPVYYAESLSAAAPLSAADFGTITRADGIRQTTCKQWPLYTWYQDKNPGELKGEGVGKIWFILESPHCSVMIGTNKTIGGNYLVDGDGNSLYSFSRDSVGKSACSGDFLKNWPAFAPSALVVPSALNPADIATFNRDDGAKQLTYKGYPLYTLARDKSRGDVAGQGVGNNWYVIDPAKFPAKS
jgi:predicted lipoprotein with Yx(FWY)xxD motif